MTPRGTVRFRLTLLYGGLFLISSAVLLAITYLLVGQATANLVAIGDETTGHQTVIRRGPPPSAVTSPHDGLTPQVQAQLRQLYTQIQHQHSTDVHQFLIQSAIALGIMAALSIGLGWLVAGRALRPLRTMTTTTQRISERNLHQRLAIPGPKDEVTDLADTIDSLLTRLENAFAAHRNFVANASHELRTPLTLQRTLLEVALADPAGDTASLRSACQRAITVVEQHEHLIDSLLTLASSERGLEHREPFDLSLVTSHVLHTARPEIDRLSLDVQTAITTAPTTGDPDLAERLVANLVDNALRHNRRGGSVQVVTGTTAGHAVISVCNTGPIIGQADLDRLFQPFQRLSLDRASQHQGHGIGLSIVTAITAAHDATLAARAQPQGGLHIEVRFPLTAAAQGGCATSR